jgi:PAS domain S-box-containing protein
MSTRHALLRRQIAAHLGDESNWSENVRRFVDAVNDAYLRSDLDRALLEQSLDHSSQELLQASSDMRAVIQAFPDLFLWLSTDGTVLECRGQDSDVLQVPPRGLVGRSIRNLPSTDAAHRFWIGLQQIVAGAPLARVEYSLLRGEQRVHCEVRLLPLPEQQILAIVRNITDNVTAELELERSVSVLRATLESTADGIQVVDATGRISTFNQKFVDLWGIPEIILRTRSDEAVLAFIAAQVSDAEAFLGKVRDLYRQPYADAFDEVRLRDGRVFERYSMPHRIAGNAVGRVWSFRDITAKRRAEQALHEREQQLRQAQKMEAVGLLAGGIAHDFNNLLTAITGYSSLVLEELDAAHPCRGDILEIQKAGDSAAALTQQLLAFSRRQILQPQVVDLNAVVSRTDALLRRLIGEDIELESQLAAALHLVSVDPGQIEQIIVNLAVNARDAMPDGGRLTIATENVDLDDRAAGALQGVAAGAHVMLAVSDNGAGMDEHTRAHIFEPFFTTKKRGEGTGLGLATVYGIVRQSGGAISVTTALNRGTTFRIYFPRAEKEQERMATASPCDNRGGTETILLVEDQPEVRSVVEAILKRHRYTVLSAGSGEEALRLAADTAHIDLLLTDVVMPAMSGRELSSRLLLERPGLRVLFASGYTDDAIVRHGVFEADVAFIQKPFSPAALLAKVREVLDQPVLMTPDEIVTNGSGVRTV